MEMKVLRILNRLNVGGPTYNVANLSSRLPQDYETQVLVGHHEPDEASSAYLLDQLNIPYQYVPAMYRSINPRNDAQAYRFIAAYIRRWQPDIVHTHAAKAGALGRLAARWAGKRPKLIVHTYHGNVFDGYFSPLKTKIILFLERYLCRISDVIIAISETQKKDLVEKYKIAPAEKIKVVRLGFDLSKFTAGMDQKRNIFRQEFGLSDDTIIITSTGRLAPIKNPLLLIDAMAILVRKYPSFPLKLFFVGDGELLEACQKAAISSGLIYCMSGGDARTAQVVFTSWRKDIDVVNAGSDIVALSSINEGTPVSIIEAMASGKAVVATNVGGVADVIENTVSGLLSSQHAGSFAEKLSLLINNPEFRENLGHEGRKSVLANYSAERLAADMDVVYRSALRC